MCALAAASGAQAAPTAPSGVTARVASATSITLTWAKSPDPQFSYFAVRRSSDPTLNQADWTRLAGNDTTPTVTDTNLTTGTTYYYYVTAIDTSKAVSARSAVVSAVPAAPAAVAGSCASVGTEFCGDFSTGNLSQYTQELGSPASGITVETNQLEPPASHSDRVELQHGETWTDGTNRMQLREAGFGEGSDLYFHISVMIDPSTTIGCGADCTGTPGSGWRSIFSWPTTQNGTCSEGGFGLETEDSSNVVNSTGTPVFDQAGDGGVCGANNTTYWHMYNGSAPSSGVASPIKGDWYSFIVHRYISYDATKGFFEEWLKKPGENAYTKQTFLNGSQIMYMRTLGCSGCSVNMRVGDYRNAKFPGTDVLYFSNIRAATSFASAQ